MNKHFIAILQLIPVIISALLIAAHFLRANNLILAAISLLVLLGLLIRRSLFMRVVQVALLLATAEWIRTTLVFVSLRTKMDLPWTRLAIILSAVALFTLASSLVFFSKTLKKRYGL
ncbi:MAG: hypothetical protein ACE5D7_09225 [Fidelibacterota bacterium]